MTQNQRPRDLLANAMEEYISFKSMTSWKSTSSRAANASTLRNFIRALSRQLQRDPLTDDLEDALVMKTISERWPETGTTTTHGASFSRVQQFANWIVASGYQTGSLRVFLASAQPRSVQPEVTFLTRDEARRTFDAVHPYAPCHAYLVWIAFLLARRPAEMQRLKVGDYDPTRSKDAPHGTYTYTETKAHKGRIKVRLTSSQRDAIEAWLTEYRENVGVKSLRPSWYMFPGAVSAGESAKGRRRMRRLMPESPIVNISQTFARAYKEAGVYEKGKAGHAARRGGATDDHDALEEAGVADPIQHIQRKLGHTDRRVTTRYVRRSEGERKTWEALQMVDDIRAGKISQPEPDTEGINESGDTTGEELAKVIQLPFGRRGA